MFLFFGISCREFDHVLFLGATRLSANGQSTGGGGGGLKEADGEVRAPGSNFARTNMK